MRVVTIAALLAATPALAQEPPTTIGFGLTTGTFEEAGDIDTYRVKLTKGRDYAFGANSGAFGELTLKGPTGTPLCTLNPWEGEGGGCEFRAGRDGYFTIVAREDNGGPVPAGYSLRLHPDCRSDTKTRCQIRPGATQSHALAYGEEVDLVKLTDLKPGRTYTVSLSDDPYCAGAILTIVNGQGATVGQGGVVKGGTVPLFAKVEGQSAFCSGGPYRLALR